jgi:hypothetical protein
VNASRSPRVTRVSALISLWRSPIQFFVWRSPVQFLCTIRTHIANSVGGPPATRPCARGGATTGGVGYSCARCGCAPCGRIARIVLSFSRMCNFPKDSTGVTKFSTNVTFSDKTAILSDLRGRAAGRFLGEMTTPVRPGNPYLQFLVGIFSQKKFLYGSA